MFHLTVIIPSVNIFVIVLCYILLMHVLLIFVAIWLLSTDIDVLCAFHVSVSLLILPMIYDGLWGERAGHPEVGKRRPRIPQHLFDCSRSWSCLLGHNCCSVSTGRQGSGECARGSPNVGQTKPVHSRTMTVGLGTASPLERKRHRLLLVRYNGPHASLTLRVTDNMAACEKFRALQRSRVLTCLSLLGLTLWHRWPWLARQCCVIWVWPRACGSLDGSQRIYGCGGTAA